MKATSLWKIYPSGESTIQAVKGVNVTIEAGEMVAIMGPSGCGKTTLLNILSGIDEPNSGDVTVKNRPLFGISDDDRTRMRAEHLGFIFQDFNLLPVLSAVENVELPLLLLGKSASEAHKGALAALNPLASKTEQNIDLLSYPVVSNNVLQQHVPWFTILQSFFVTNRRAILILRLLRKFSNFSFA